MDHQLIQQIADEVVRRLPHQYTSFLILQVILFGLAACAGAFFSEYLKTRGKNLATKADFDNLRDQLRANTEIVETIKSEVSQKDWAARERALLYRTKLEALLEKMHECEQFLKKHRDQALEAKALEEIGPDGQFRTIAELYFPELQPEVSSFLAAYSAERQLYLQLTIDLVKAGENEAARKNTLANFRTAFDARPSSEIPTMRLRARARELLLKIVG
jgi:hypothetical protein